MTDATGQRQTTMLTRLSVMMFIQFFIWGAWYVTVGQYMAKIGLEQSIGWVYTVGPIAALISPLFLGMIADRFFNSERVLSVLLLVGGGAMFLVPSVAEQCAAQWAATKDGWIAAGLDPATEVGEGFLVIFPPLVADHLPFIGLIFAHMLCFMPTLGLTNTIAFRNIASQEKDFPIVRVFGTIGWIIAGIIVSVGMHADETSTPLVVAGISSIALGLYAFTLPKTPPPLKGQAASLDNMLGLDALGMMRESGFAVFIICSLLICIPLAGYYAFAQVFVNHTGFTAPAGTMTIGQMSEIVFMLLIPFFFSRLGVKWMLAIGMLAWASRYALFAVAAPDGVRWMVLGGIALHGICYDFFFVTGFIYTDKKAPAAIRAQAQGFLVLVTQGLGLGIGAQVMQRIVNRYKSPDYDQLTAQAGALRDQATAVAKSQPAESDALLAQASELLLGSYDWRMIWVLPAAFAGAILVIFVAGFWDRSVDAQS